MMMSRCDGSVFRTQRGIIDVGPIARNLFETQNYTLIRRGKKGVN